MLLTKPNSLELNVCIEYYLTLCRAKGQSINTVQVKSNALKQFERWSASNGVAFTDKIDLDWLDNYQYYLYQYRKANNGEPLCRDTIRYRLTAVKVLIRTLFIKDVLLKNTTEYFELPTTGRRLPKPILSEAEIEKIMSQTEYYGLRGIRDRAVMETYYASGIRRFELGQLTLQDIDFDLLQLRVNQGKGYKDRYVPIAKTACYWIYRYLDEVRGQLAQLKSGNALFLANSGNPFSPSQLSDLVAKYIRLADIGKTGACNQYRHAAATHMVDNGADIRHVQEFLGHSDLSTTQIYVHVSMAKLREVYNRTHPAARKRK